MLTKLILAVLIVGLKGENLPKKVPRLTKEQVWIFWKIFNNLFFQIPNFPLEFNSAKQWPECKPLIELIDDQQFSRTCFYFALAHVLADRFCVKTKGKVMVSLSAWDFTTCCPNKVKFAEYLWRHVNLTGLQEIMRHFLYYYNFGFKFLRFAAKFKPYLRV